MNRSLVFLGNAIIFIGVTGLVLAAIEFGLASQRQAPSTVANTATSLRAAADPRAAQPATLRAARAEAAPGPELAEISSSNPVDDIVENVVAEEAEVDIAGADGVAADGAEVEVTTTFAENAAPADALPDLSHLAVTPLPVAVRSSPPVEDADDEVASGSEWIADAGAESDVDQVWDDAIAASIPLETNSAEMAAEPDVSRPDERSFSEPSFSEPSFQELTRTLDRNWRDVFPDRGSDR